MLEVQDPVSPSRAVPLVILGTGGIGRTLLRQLQQRRVHLRATHALDLPIIALAGSRAMVVGDPALDSETIDAVVEHGLSGASLYRSTPEDEQIALLDSLSDRMGGRVIVIDASASDHTTPVLLHAARLGHHLVMANKRPLASAMDVWYEIMAARKRGQCVRHEATVGAGLPVIATLQGLVDSGDEVISIDACLSGTLNFLCTALEDGQAFSEAAAEARGLGITEPDPRDDLGGLDVARKALILARMLGVRAELDDIRRESLVPERLMAVSLEEFLEALPTMDAAMGSRQRSADEQGLVLRYLVEVRPGDTRVGLVAVPQATPLGRLRGTDNLISFRTARYAERTMLVAGPGAGREVTAAAVFSDILQIATLAPSGDP